MDIRNIPFEYCGATLYHHIIGIDIEYEGTLYSVICEEIDEYEVIEPELEVVKERAIRAIKKAIVEAERAYVLNGVFKVEKK